MYERGSDGKVLSVLTSPRVVSYEIKHNWSVLSLLRDIATSRTPVFHCLIDTGALITGMENREVASFLLEAGLNEMEGCVYLDSEDQQMVLLRSSPNVPVPRSQCGLASSKIFTFFDQIHTTGIDTLQSPNAVAVVTLGKDMTFRDYAQGAFRMRQIGKGQKICLFVIPEVLKLVERELGLEKEGAKVEEVMTAGEEQGEQKQLVPSQYSGSESTDDASSSSSSLLLQQLPTHVSAWLTINSMRMEQLQFYQLCLQNLHSVWRKKAFAALLQDSITPSPPQLVRRQRSARSCTGFCFFFFFMSVQQSSFFLSCCLVVVPLCLPALATPSFPPFRFERAQFQLASKHSLACGVHFSFQKRY